MNNRELKRELDEVRQGYQALRIENEKLKVETETKAFKLAQAEEKCQILEKKLSERQYTDIDALAKRNQDLVDEIRTLKFDMENDTAGIVLKTENAKLSSKVEAQASEINYLKELLEAYRSMPDVKQMIDNLSSLSVPNVDKLREFAKMVNESKLSELCELVRKNTELAERAYAAAGYRRGF